MNTVVDVAVLAAGTLVSIAFIIVMGMNTRAGIRADNRRAADEALTASRKARDEAAAKLTEARELAQQFRELREWIE